MSIIEIVKASKETTLNCAIWDAVWIYHEVMAIAEKARKEALETVGDYLDRRSLDAVDKDSHVAVALADSARGIRALMNQDTKKEGE